MLLPYCDNLTVLGTSRERVDQCKDAAVKFFPVHEIVYADFAFQTLGVFVDERCTAPPSAVSAFAGRSSTSSLPNRT